MGWYLLREEMKRLRGLLVRKQGEYVLLSRKQELLKGMLMGSVIREGLKDAKVVELEARVKELEDVARVK